MSPDERDALLLTLLDPPAQATLEAMADEIIAQQGLEASPADLAAWAAAFEQRVEDEPDDRKIVGLILAAVLRRRTGRA